MGKINNENVVEKHIPAFGVGGSKLQLLPIPVVGAKAHVAISSQKNTLATISITDVTGKKNLLKKVTGSASTNNIDLDVSGLAYGILCDV